MKFPLFFICLINMGFLACQQKKLIINFNTLEEKELRIYFDMNEYPKLQYDSNGNMQVNFDSSNTVYTSTKFSEILNFRDIYCLGDKNLCLSEEYEWEKLGFSINGYSHFTSDTLNKKNYLNPYHSILITKIKAEEN